ncbi:M14 family zinc carboxypeptidase, partial [Actinomadura rugatobispora]
PAAAEATGKGGGARLHSNAELARELKRIERAGHGRVRVRSIGTSNQGRPLWFATLGTGPQRLLYVTQQHGDEPLGTESALMALRTLGLKNDRASRELRSKITLGVLVRANPDGHHHQWRYNYDPDAQPEYGEPGKGYDMNRYHDPAVRPEDNPVPEAAAIQRQYAAFRPSIVVDYHMQGRYAFPPPDGREITTSIQWPTAEGVPAGALTTSKQVGVRVHDAFTRAGAVVSQYPGGSYQGIARNAYGLRGSASLLVELSDLPPDRQNFQIRTAYVSMVDLARAAANGALDGIDPSRADAIPPRGPELPDASATRHAGTD